MFFSGNTKNFFSTHIPKPKTGGNWLFLPVSARFTKITYLIIRELTKNKSKKVNVKLS